MRKILLFVFFFLMQGCSLQPVKLSETPLHFSKHIDTLSSMQSWKFKAQIGVKDKTQGGSFTLHFSQNNQEYDILALGSFGKTLAELKGHSKQALLKTPNEPPLLGDPNLLIQKVLGSKVPFEPFSFWVRGIPYPHAKYKAAFNAEATLIEIQQLGWTLDYQNFSVFNGVSLPQKILIEKENVRVKINIASWEIPNAVSR